MTRFAALDGLRGISAVMVALCHLPVAFHVFGSPLVREAYVFVDFFFVLSGFVIAHAYSRRIVGPRDFTSFLIRRVGRLWPLHVAMLGTLFAIECLRLAFVFRFGVATGAPPFTGQTALEHLPASILLVQAWGFGGLVWNVPSWSISSELLAYILFGLIILVTRSRALVVATVLVAMTWFASLATAHEFSIWEAFRTVRAVCGFFVGVMVYAVHVHFQRPRWSYALATALEVAVATLVLVYLLFISRPEMNPWATPIFAVAIYVFAAERGALSRLLTSPPMRYLGATSYSIYLTHAVVIALFLFVGNVLGIVATTPAELYFPAATARGMDWNILDFGNVWVNDAYAIALLATVLGVSALTHRTIELPGQAVFKRLAERSVAAGAAPMTGERNRPIGATVAAERETAA